jgi:hypothetical protein
MSQQGRSKDSARELGRILSAIAGRNPEKARAACIEHVACAARAAKASFQGVTAMPDDAPRTRRPASARKDAGRKQAT